MAHIIKFRAKYDDYFIARLDNGWLRIGLRGCECFSFPPNTPEYRRVFNAEPDQIEALYDEFVITYLVNR